MPLSSSTRTATTAVALLALAVVVSACGKTSEPVTNPQPPSAAAAQPAQQPSRAATAAAWRDPSPHQVRFVTVAPDVRLEVLDWGGSGRPVVLLTGLGNTAHVFDDFAPKLTTEYHVYGITRRGFGASSVPASGYDADRLGDDVLTVLDKLEIVRPVLVGHSVAGTELSSIATRRPERVAGVVYLEAAYRYAFDNGKGVSAAEVQKANADMNALAGQQPLPTEADLASFEALRMAYLRITGLNYPESEFRATSDTLPDGRPGPQRQSPARALIQAGTQKYVDIRGPVLAIYALPQDFGPSFRERLSVDPKLRDAWEQRERLKVKDVSAFEEGVPGARVVRIANAHHVVFLSNEAEVLREVRAFIGGLK